jgi:multisubunit Na+/H+ antiporter MnhC subunit
MVSMREKLHKSLAWLPATCICVGIALLVFLIVGVVRRYDFVRTFSSTQCRILSAKKSCLYIDDQVAFSGYGCWLLNVSNPILQAQNKTASVTFRKFSEFSNSLDGCNGFEACGSVTWPCVYNPKNIVEVYLKVHFPVLEVILITAVSLSLVGVGLYVCLKRWRAQNTVPNMATEENSPF